MAMRLTHSPAIDNPSNTANVSGASASMMANCRRTAFETRATTAALFDDPALVAARMTPTATNDSQKPADSGAKGSSSRTTISASVQVRPAPACRAESRASAKQASISQVRCAGTEKPASNEYAPGCGETQHHREGLAFDEARPRQQRMQPSPHETRDEESNQREQRDVQSRNGDQMRRAGGVEHAPLIRAQTIGEPH